MTDGFCAACGSIDRLSPATSLTVALVERKGRVVTIHRRCFDPALHVVVVRDRHPH